MIDKVLEFVIDREDYFYEKAIEAAEQKDTLSNAMHIAQAKTFQRVRYFIEDLKRKEGKGD